MRTSLFSRIAALALLLGAGLGFAPGAQAQTGSTNVAIDVTNGITILYYYDALTVQTNLANVVTLPATGCAPAAGDTRACNLGTGGTVVASETPGNITAAFTITPPTLGALNAVTLNLNNVWAVRALGGGANTTVSISNTAATLTNGASTIGLSNWLVGSSAPTVIAPANSINFADPGLVNARTGNVVVTANFTGTSTVGVHAAAGTEYTLTVNNT